MVVLGFVVEDHVMVGGFEVEVVVNGVGGCSVCGRERMATT